MHNTYRLQVGRLTRTKDRRGMIAFGEILLVLVGLVGLAGIVHFGLMSMAGNPAGSSHCSARPVYRISLSRDERSLWVYRLREQITHLDPEHGQVDRILFSPGDKLLVVAFSDDGTRAVTLNATGEIVVYHQDEVETLHALPNGEKSDAFISHNRTVVLSATSDGTVHCWVKQGTDQYHFQRSANSTHPVLQVGLNPAADWYFVARGDGSVSMFAIDEQEAVPRTFNMGLDNVAFAWSPDESRFAAVTSSGRIRMYDLQACRLLYENRIDESLPPIGVAVLNISPDGQRMTIATQATSDVLIWDVNAGQLLGRLKGHSGLVRSLQFSADSHRLYTGSYDGTVREWSLKSYSQIRQVN